MRTPHKYESTWKQCRNCLQHKVSKLRIEKVGVTWTCIVKSCGFVEVVTTCMLLFASIASAGVVNIAWDASPTPDVSYRVYAMTNSLGLTNAPLVMDVNTNLAARIEFSTNASRWYFVVTAVNTNSIESEPSNEIIIDVPAAPSQFRVVTLQHSAVLTNGWNDMGYFRVRIE